MKVVFLGANCSYSHTSLAAWCLQVVVQQAGYTWETIEVTIKDDPDMIVSRILAAKPDVVAATLYLFNREFVAGVLGKIERTKFIIVGGPECLGDNRALVRDDGIADVAVRGEGELAFPAFLKGLRNGTDWWTIPGLCTTHAGEYIDNGQAEAVADLDSLPPFYPELVKGFRKPFIQLETSRGCGNGCLFCTSRRTPVRVRSLDRVRADLQAIALSGVREVRVVDRTFNDERTRALALTALLRDEFPNLRFHLEIDPSRFGQALANEFGLAKPGQFHIEAGIQSLSPAVYTAIERQATVDRTLEGLRRLCGLKNIEVHVDLIAGLPGGTLQGLMNDLRTLMALAPQEIQLERLKLLPGTPLAQTPGQWGLVGLPGTPYSIQETQEMTSNDMARADRLSKLLDWFYNVESLRDLIAEGVGGEESFLDEFEKWIEAKTGYSTCPDMESRFKLLDGFLDAKRSMFPGGTLGRRDSLLERLRYRWYRLGFSTRHGPCPFASWKQAIPASAALVEGDASLPCTRICRVELAKPHFFCYGTGPGGERAVVAVWRESLV